MAYLHAKVSRASKRPRKRLKLASNNIYQSLFVIFLGLALITYGGVNFYQARVLSFKKIPPPQNTPLLGLKPVRLQAPSVKIDLPIEEGSIVVGVWQISPTKATFLDSSAPLKVGGNTVLYGHNKKTILGNLGNIKIGDKIYLTDEQGAVLSYEVYTKVIVNPDRVDLVSPTSYEELTIYTCWGVFDSQRVVIKAKPSI